MTQAVHMMVFEGFADWEPAHTLAELRRSGNRSVVIVGFDTEPITSMGGLRVVPDRKLSEVRATDVEIFLLPGGDFWEGAYPRAGIEGKLKELVSANVPVAAICAGTLAVARAGLLDTRRHISNMPGYIGEHVSEYSGATSYEQVPAVTDRGVITASGLAPIEFALEIFRELKIFSAEDEQLWFEMFKHGAFHSRPLEL